MRKEPIKEIINPYETLTLQDSNKGTVEEVTEEITFGRLAIFKISIQGFLKVFQGYLFLFQGCFVFVLKSNINRLFNQTGGAWHNFSVKKNRQK